MVKCLWASVAQSQVPRRPPPLKAEVKTPDSIYQYVEALVIVVISYADRGLTFVLPE